MSNIKREKRIIRHKRVRSKIFGTAERPRLAVFRSNKNITAQLINDETGETLGYVWTKKITTGKTLREKSETAGKEIAELAKAKKITEAVFDKGGFIFTGNIKALAEAARSGGLKF